MTSRIALVAIRLFYCHPLFVLIGTLVYRLNSGASPHVSPGKGKDRTASGDKERVDPAHQGWRPAIFRLMFLLRRPDVPKLGGDDMRTMVTF